MTTPSARTLRRIREFLQRNLELPYCDLCLAHDAEVPREEARIAVDHVGRTPGFRLADRLCIRCMRPGPVISAVEQAPLGEQR